MAEVVDTKVVEARFDSAQFEKGVNKTVKKLDELKKSLNLEQSGKSIAQLASKTQEATEKASGALDKLSKSFTNFTGMLRQKLLSGIADEVVGAVFKIKNAFEGLVNTLSSQQISYGMQRYVDIMGSVRTLVFSGVEQNTAYDTIERLGTYADQTSYSLDQLVSTMSKFKTAGANLKTAERMVIGLSNAAASMGVNAQDASRAYLNLQQAYSKGAMQQNDWISFESLPMVGEKFNQAILDAAVKMKTLEKTANGTYKTINKVDKQVKTSGADSKGITAENLGTKLSSRWFNKQVMEEVFGSTYYFNIPNDLVDKFGEEVTSSETVSRIKAYEEGMKKSGKDLEKEMKSMQQEVKDQKMTQDEYVERVSKFAAESTFDNIDEKFQKYAPDTKEVQKELEKFLKENGYEKISYEDLYTKQLEGYLDTIETQMVDQKRKELDAQLEAGDIQIEEYTKALEDFQKSLNLTRFGWEAYRAGQEARSFNDVLNTLKDTISRGWATSFELIFGKLDDAAKFFTWLTESKLANAIYSIGEFRNNMLEMWQGDEHNGGRKDLLDALETLDNILGKILGKFIIFNSDDENFEDAAKSLGANLSEATMNFKNFTHELDAWLNEERLDRIHDFIATIGNVLGTIFNAAAIALNFARKAFVTFEPLMGAVIDNVNKIVNRVNEVFKSNGLGSLQNGLDNILIIIKPLTEKGGFLERFINFLGDIGAFFAEMAAGTFTSNIQFFSDTLGFIIELFGGTSAQKAEDGVGVIGGIKNAIVELGNACRDAFQFVADFFHNLYEDLLQVFGVREAGDGEEGGYFANLIKFFDGNTFIETIKGWIKKIPEVLKKLWNTIDEFLFGKKVTMVTWNGKTATRTVTSQRIKSGFSKFLEDMFKAIGNFITVDIPKKAKEIWNTVVEALFGKQDSYGNMSNKYGANISAGSKDWVKEGFAQWLTNAVDSVKDWITSLPEQIKALWERIIDMIFYRDPNPGEVDPVSKVAYGPNDRVKNGVLTWLEKLPGNLYVWIKKDLPEFIENIWNGVLDFIFGEKVTVQIKDPETGKVVKTVEQRAGTWFTDWIKGIPDKISGWIEDLPGKIADIWNKLVDFVLGKEATEDNLKEAEIDLKSGYAYIAGDRIKSGFSAWLDSIIGSVKTWLGEGGVHGKILGIWNMVLDAIFGQRAEAFDQNRYDELYLSRSEADAEKYKANTASKSIIDRATEFAKNLGLNLGKIISSIPAHIVNGWNFSMDLFGSLVEHITQWFKDNKDTDAIANLLADETSETAHAAADEIAKDDKEKSPFVEAIITLGKNIARIFTTTIPEFLTSAFEFIKKNAPDIIKFLEGIFEVPSNWLETLKKKAENIGKDVGDAIRSIPNLIRSAVASIKQTLGIGEQAFSWDMYDFLLKNASYDEAEEYKREFKDKFNLGKIVKDIFDAGKDALVDLGPDILKILKSAVGKIGEGLTWVTNFLTNRDKNEDLGNSLTKAIGADEELGKDSAFGQALADLGASIGNLITEIIPNFISAAIDEVVYQVPKMLQKLGDLFSGKGIDGLIGGETKDENTFEAEPVTVEVPVTTRMVGADTTANGVVDTSELDEKSREEAVKKEAKRLYDNALEEYNKFNDMMTSAFEKHQQDTSNAYYESEYLSAKASVIKYEQQMKDLKKYMETGEGTVEELYELTGTAAKATENEGNFFSNVIGIVKSIGTSDMAAVAVIILAVQNIIESLTDTVQVSDELEAAAKVAKWNAIEIAIAGIVGIMAWTYTLASMDNGTKFYRVKSILDGFCDLLVNIGDVVKFVSGFYFGGKAVGDVANMVTSLADTKEAGKNLVEGATEAAEETEKSGGILTGLLGMLTNTGGGVLAGYLGSMAVSSITSILGEGLAGFFDGLAESLSLIGVAVDTFMGLLTPTIEKLSDVKEDVETGIVVVGEMKEMLDTFYEILKDAQTGTIPNYGGGEGWHGGGPISKVTAATEDINDTISSKIRFIYFFMDVMERFSKALKDFSSVEDPRAEMEELISIITDENGGFNTLLAGLNRSLIELIKATYVEDSFLFYADSPENAASYFSLLGAFLEVFATSVRSLDMESVSAMQQAFDLITSLATILSEAGIAKEYGVIASLVIKDVDLGRFGRLLAMFGTNIRSFFGNISEVRKIMGTGTDEDYTDAFRTVGAIVHSTMHEISEVLIELNSSKNIWDLLSQIFGDSNDKFGQFISAFGAGLEAYFIAMHDLRFNREIEWTEEDVDYFRNITEIFKKVVETLDIINHWGLDVAAFSNLRTKVHRLFASIIGNEQLDLKDSKMDGTVSSYTGLVEYLKQFMTSFDSIVTRVSGVDAGSRTEIFKLYFERIKVALDAFNQMTEFLKNISDPEAEFSKLEENVGDYVALLNKLTDSSSTFTKFLDMTKSFDSTGLRNASTFADTLYHLSFALQMFADNAPASSTKTGYDYWKHLIGLDNLLNMNWDDVKSVGQKLADVFTDPEIVNGMETNGANIISGLTKGIRSGIEDAEQAMKNVATALSKTFTVELEIHSPSEVFARFGKYLDLGLADGIEKYGAAPVFEMGEVSNNLVDKAIRALNNPNTPKEIKDFAQMIVDGLISKEEFDELTEYGKRTATVITKAADEELQKRPPNGLNSWLLGTFKDLTDSGEAASNAQKGSKGSWLARIFGVDTVEGDLKKSLEGVVESASDFSEKGLLGIFGIDQVEDGVQKSLEDFLDTLKGANWYDAFFGDLTNPDKALGGFTKVEQALADVLLKGAAADGVKDAMEQNGNDSVDGFVKGVNDRIGAAKNVVENFARSVIGAFRLVMLIHSPSKVTEEDGKNYVDGLANGIEENSGNAVDAVSRLSKEMQEAIEHAKLTLIDPNASKDSKKRAQEFLDSILPNADEVRKEAEKATSELNGATQEGYDKAIEDGQKELEKSKEDIWLRTARKVLDYGSHGNIIAEAVETVHEASEKIVAGVTSYAVTEAKELLPNLTETLLGNGMLSPDYDWGVKDLFSVLAAGFADGRVLYQRSLNKTEEDTEEETLSFIERMKAFFTTPVETAGARWMVDLGMGLLGLTDGTGVQETRYEQMKTSAEGFMDNAMAIIGPLMAAKAAESAPNLMQALFDAGVTDGSLTGVNLENAKANLGSLLLAMTKDVGEDANSMYTEAAASIMGGIFTALANSSDEEDNTLEPKITPVLNITDSFKKAQDDINNFFGFRLFQWDFDNPGGLGNLFQLPSLPNGPQQTAPDYTDKFTAISDEMRQMHEETHNLGEQMGKMKFVINGKEFAYAVGPDINDYLGYEDSTRGSRYTAWNEFQA